MLTKTDTLLGLAARAADIVETDGGQMQRIEIGEMADGSTCQYALVYMYDPINELEQVYRVTSPPSDDAPAWVNANLSWTIELRIGDDWMLLGDD